jgi:hypothetical protein
MYLVAKDAMASKLDPAWTFLSGVQRHFEEASAQASRPGEREHAVVLPVQVHDDPRERCMAVGLLIDDGEATGIARFMFGIPTGDVSVDDVRDACMEACNVLGGCLVVGNTGGQRIEIGLPQELPLSRFSQLQRDAVITVTFSSADAAGRRIVITVFDAVDQRILES